MCERVRVRVRVCTGVRGFGSAYVGVCARACVYVCVCVVCSWVYACECVGVRACVRACVCVSYLYSLLTVIKTLTQHRLSGSILHFIPIVDKHNGSRCFFLCLY